MKKYPIISKNVVLRRVNKKEERICRLFPLDNEKNLADLNLASEEIVEKCDGTNSISDIVNLISSKYNNPIAEIELRVNKVIKFLNEKKCINILEKKADISQKREIYNPVDLKHELIAMFIETTRRCNLKCVHCYAYSPDLKQEIEYKDICNIIDQFAEIGGVRTTLSGGEPLLRNDILDIIKYILNKSLSVMLLSNGILIDKKMAKNLKDSGLGDIQISIDGPNSEVHDEFRGKKGVFKLSCKAIDYLLEEGLNVTIASVINRFNYEYAFDIIDFCNKRWGIDPSINFQKTQGKVLTQCEKYKSTLYENMKKQIEVSKYMANKNHYNPFQIVYSQINTNNRFRCGAGINSLSIGYEGSIKACIDMEEKLGNIKKDRLFDVWTSDHPVLNFFRNNSAANINLCNQCSHFEYCDLGCPLEAKRVWGDYNWPDIEKCMYYQITSDLLKIKKVENKEEKMSVCKF